MRDELPAERAAPIGSAPEVAVWTPDMGQEPAVVVDPGAELRETERDSIPTARAA